MIYVAVGQLLVIALLLYMLWSEREAQAKVLAEFSKEAERERRELLNRIAQPGMIVPDKQTVPRREPRDLEQYNKIGTVQPPKMTNAPR